MNYTAVIRTLGTAGEKYQTLLGSLNQQTVQPSKILVYIAEGYTIPKETIGKEQYIYVKKGMVAQRALPYKEVDTEFILFLDDDVYLPETAVEQLYQYLTDYHADVISPDVFPNAERSFLGKCLMMLSGRMLARKNDGKWGYKVMRNSGYSYNNHPKPGVYWSQTNAGPCFFCRKADFLKIHFEEERWMDNLKYAVGGYFKAQFKIMGIVFLILLAGLGFLKIHYFVLIAFLIAFLDFLPFFGTGTAMIPWAVYEVFMGEYKVAAALLIIYVVTQAVRQLIQPKLVGDSVGLNPLVTLLLLYIGYRVGGVIWMILAVPVGMVIINMCQAGAFDYIFDDVKILTRGILGLRQEQQTEKEQLVKAEQQTKKEELTEEQKKGTESTGK